MSIILKGGKLFTGTPADIRVEGGRIAAIGSELVPQPGDEVCDVTGLILAPGLIDMHVHLREPGFEYKETIQTGTRAAAKGGVSAVACMPNTKPVTDNAAVVRFVRERAAQVGKVKVYPIGAITKGSQGQELAEMGDMLREGAVAFSDDGRPVENGQTMRLALTYAQNFGALCISHCEDLALANGGVMNEGYMSTILGLRGVTRAAEEAMAARDILIAEAIGGRVHIAHVSTRGTVELVRQAKARGVQVTCETAPHYFALTDECVQGYDADTKVNPPLRTADDVAAVKEGLRDGTIDCIVTDHAPHHVDEKRVEYNLASSGISGLETSLALALTHLVRPGVLTLPQLVERMSAAPARILGVEGGCLEEGAAADILAFDPDLAWTVDPAAFESRGHNTPFKGQELRGQARHLLVNGKFVLRDGEVLA